MLRTTATSLLLIALLPLTAPAADSGDDLLTAARKGDVDAVKAPGQGGRRQRQERLRATALSFAADKGRLEVVKVLLQHKADVNAKDTFYKASPLDWAVMRNNVDIVKVLLEAGAEGAGDAF